MSALARLSQIALIKKAWIISRPFLISCMAGI
jgi:hypothetical protein